MSKKYLFIINPVGGNGKVKRKWSKIEHELKQSGLTYDVWFTEYRMHAAKLAEKAISKGYRRIIAVGGDGTNNEVVNGLIKQTIVSPEEIYYTLLPIGTGNDWSKTHNIPLNIKNWLPMLLAENTILHDIGEVSFFNEGKSNSRYFINVAGMAYDGFVGKFLEEKKSKYFNQFFYLFYIFRCLFKYELQPASVLIDGNKKLKDKFYTINLGICRYSAGGMQFVPHANPTDRQFALSIAGNISKWKVIKATPYFYNGKIKEHPQVNTYFAKKVDIEGLDMPLFLEVDGEFLGETPVSFRISKKQLRVIVPKKINQTLLPNHSL